MTAIAAASSNVLIYATSNRRHLLPEYFSENLETRHIGEEVHPGESVEEKISLSERFGLWISFYPFQQDDYLAAVAGWLDALGAVPGRRTSMVGTPIRVPLGWISILGTAIPVLPVVTPMVPVSTLNCGVWPSRTMILPLDDSIPGATAGRVWGRWTIPLITATISAMSMVKTSELEYSLKVST